MGDVQLTAPPIQLQEVEGIRRTVVGIAGAVAGGVVLVVGEGVVHSELGSIPEILLQLHNQRVIFGLTEAGDGVGVADVRIQTREIESAHRAAVLVQSHAGRVQVPVPRGREEPAGPQVGRPVEGVGAGDAQVPCDLLFDSDLAVDHTGALIVGIHVVDGRGTDEALDLGSRGRGEQAGITQAEAEQVGGGTEEGNENDGGTKARTGQHSGNENSGRGGVVNTGAAADDGAAPAAHVPGESHAGREVVEVVGHIGGGGSHVD